MINTNPQQRHLPFETTDDALADMYERSVRSEDRLVRIESRLVRLLLHSGLDENGFPRKPPTTKPQKETA